jgi:hypothetical protein
VRTIPIGRHPIEPYGDFPSNTIIGNAAWSVTPLISVFVAAERLCQISMQSTRHHTLVVRERLRCGKLRRSQEA